MAGTALALQPSFPATPYYGQWTADLGYYAWYRGEVLSAEMDGMQLPWWRLADSRRVRSDLLAGEPLLVRAVAGPRTDRLAPIFSIYDAERREILLVGADRDDLVLHVRARATDALLRQPELRWPRAMAGVVPGDTLTIGVRRAGTGYCLSLGRRGEQCGLAFTLGETWALVQFSPHLPGAAEDALDALVMAALAFAVGALAPRRRATLAVMATLLAGALLLPPLLDLGPTPPLQLAALLVGAALGLVAPERGQVLNAPLDAVEG